MVNSTDDLTTLVARAASIKERLREPPEFFGDEDPAAAAARRQAWIQRLSGTSEDASYLARRLAWAQWNERDVHRVLAAPLRRVTTPAWQPTLESIIETVAGRGQPTLRAVHADRLPFEDITAAIAAVGHARVPQPDPSLMSPTAWRVLQHSLLERLHKVCAQVFLAELDQERGVGRGLLLLMQGAQTGDGRAIYERLVRRLLKDGLIDLFTRFPVLARLVATTIDQWVLGTQELLGRLAEDQVAIADAFCAKAPGPCVELVCDLSDPHWGHRAVHALGWQDGTAVVYKPKSLELDVAFESFLDWLGTKAPCSTPRPVRTLPRPGYGWVEYAQQAPAQDEADVQAFYRRAGGLLGCLYLFGGTDCHAENFIAQQDQLTLIDIETLVYHEEKPMDAGVGAQEGQSEAARSFRGSVLHTGLLPRWEFAGKDQGMAFDISGLGGVDASSASSQVPVRQWVNINCDDMRLATRMSDKPESPQNALLLDGIAQRPESHRSAILEGFREVYDVLRDSRDTLLSLDGPLVGFWGQPARFIVRATRVYTTLLDESVAPQALRDGIEHSLVFESLARGYLHTNEVPPAWPTLDSELAAVEAHDVPLFRARTDSCDLSEGLPDPLQDFFVDAPKAQVAARIRALTEDDLHFQSELIRTSLLGRAARGTAATVESDLTLPDEPLSSVDLRAEVGGIVAELSRRALWTDGCRANWIGLQYNPAADRFQLLPMGEGLYDGRAGVALFLAAAARYLDDSDAAELACAAVAPTRAAVKSVTPDHAGPDGLGLARTLGSGGGFGPASVAYSLFRISQLLGQESMLQDALRAGWLVSPNLLAKDQRLDALSGAAGVILGLWALEAHTHDPALLTRMRAAGERLLQTQRPDGGWPTLGGQALTGMSHGAAGIALALARLAQRTGDARFEAAAERGLAFERAHFDSAVGNWPDLRPRANGAQGPSFMDAWCNGATGIAAARWAAICAGLDGPGAQEDLISGLKANLQIDRCGVDHVCCGDAGRLDLLLEVGRGRDEKEWVDTAWRRAHGMVQDRKQRGAYRLFAQMPEQLYSPAFFQGTAGIGYVLLRLMQPELPSVATWS